MKSNSQLNFICTKTIRIDEFLRQELPDALKDLETPVQISNSKIRRLIVSGAVFVNGKSCSRPSFELRGKSTVVIEFDAQKFFYEKQPDDIKFQVTEETVLYEDENLIFINKPAFFPVEQTITGNRDNLHDAVVDYLWKKNPVLRNPPYVGIMHRLDRETSGVILFTKNRQVNKIVHQMFENHDFEKKYTAIVSAESAKKSQNYKKGDSFTVEMFMERISAKSQKGKWGQVPQSKGGLYSKTDFIIEDNVIVEGKKCFQIGCSLFTGRTHQIRVHLSQKSLPILGDELYGAESAKRIYLHSEKLAFDNELGKLEIKAPLPW